MAGSSQATFQRTMTTVCIYIDPINSPLLFVFRHTKKLICFFLSKWNLFWIERKSCSNERHKDSHSKAQKKKTFTRIDQKKNLS